MKILTIITTILCPEFPHLPGLYGMNFDNMPGLHLEHGCFLPSPPPGSTAAPVCVFTFAKWL